MSTVIISIAVFVCVSAAVGAVAVMFRGGGAASLEDRLSSLTDQASSKQKALQQSPLMQPLDDRPSFLERLVNRFSKLSLLFQQADTTLTPSRFVIVSGALAAGGWFAAWWGGLNVVATVPVALIAGVLPFFWLVYRRRKRLKTFQMQLPDALELIGRALRAGHSLGAGFQLVAGEMLAPIGKEFGRVAEETNLGVSLEDALGDLIDRVPNMDLKFFATAVILQRQTGGDLAEILDKISHLIRERFALWGQVQALTGEGRLSGVVLLGLPPLLFATVWKLNPDYIMLLFTDPLGKKMLIGGIIMQLLGAIVIRKIVNIKV